jgi:hypothetical protein
MANLVDRMMRAARLDSNLYEEVEADTGAIGQATFVVVLSSLAGGIGTGVHNGVAGLLGAAIGSLVGWYIWAFLTYYIGTKWLPEPATEADTGQMLRTLGFASTPGILRIAGIVPGLGMAALVIPPLWMLCAMVIAVRQALDYESTARAIGVCLIGFFVQIAIIAALFLAFGLAASETTAPVA